MRLLPPLVINEADVSEAMNKLEKACKALKAKARLTDAKTFSRFTPDAGVRTQDDFEFCPSHEGQNARACQKEPKRKACHLQVSLLRLIFERPSTRTPRIVRNGDMKQLGGEVIVLNAGDMQLGRGESIADTARVLSRYVDGIMLRAALHDNLLTLANAATVPVINGLTDRTHPCQVMADLQNSRRAQG